MAQCPTDGQYGRMIDQVDGTNSSAARTCKSPAGQLALKI
jgi:hypothetical protein